MLLSLSSRGFLGKRGRSPLSENLTFFFLWSSFLDAQSRRLPKASPEERLRCPGSVLLGSLTKDLYLSAEEGGRPEKEAEAFF